MGTLTITAKGRITLDDHLLKHLGVRPGAKIAVEKLPDGRIGMKALETAAARPTGCISAAFGLLKRENGPSLTIEEINEATAQGWAGEPLP
ncbi:AbrB/MazE/SpoVT family DNA-binding domain-containing protein [Bosea caraganae]|uniref:AbrB/MazE/SpoVT family DNA-binding domain-containing protein n=1 Tax=Bosea caraganae TaxID=2763117 RepID=A0A370L6D2_9HYPH|nr:AbrB/MazE/SpoVT family DNA-binding domain-containing protein [Bosea caraganae]RDJ25317.1 AbrB/MazE/SpoVT family DNA-binding domain-containing protein [Bosea caraganae]RDJ25898.1 AbrB/MazE/SpoVT family DNA-binding domain-containing protein [Bosea caraganae]